MKKLIILIIFIASIKLFAQNNWESKDIYSSNVKVSSPNTCFINANTGYTVLNFESNCDLRLFKTINGGINWYYNPYKTFPNPNNEGTPNVFFLNESTGFVTKHYFSGTIAYIDLWKTTNAGVNWQQLNTINSYTNGIGYSVSQIKFINNNTGFINTETQILKTTDGGMHFYEKLDLYDPNHVKLSKINKFEINDAGTIYAGGQVLADEINYPILYISTDYCENFNPILVGGQNSEMGVIRSLCFHMNNELILMTNTSDDKYYFYKYINNNFQQLTSFDEQYPHIDICSSISGDLYASEYSYPPVLGNVYEYVYRSSDIGNSWTPDFELERSYNGYSMNYLNNFKDIVSYSVMNYNNNLISRVRNLDMTLRIYAETTPISGSILSINGYGPYDIPQGGRLFYLKGGNNSIKAYDHLTNQQNNLDEIFFKWNDNSINPDNQSYYFETKGEISPIYKTKFKSTDINAINNISQTKAFRDSTNHFIHEIHQSMGSIFYSNMSSLNGDFNREEFVNGGANYYTQYPNENTSEGNKNPSICWIKQFGNPIESYAQYCIAATWERFNASNNKLQIFGAIKVDECNPITAFKRYGSDPDNQNSYTGILREFNASSNFGSKPEIISAFYHTDGVDLNDPYDYFYIVPHLEPASSGNKLVITAKYHDLQGFDGINYIWNDNNFIIENQDVYEFSVEGTQFHWDNNNQFGYFNLHLAYQKGNDIIYRMEQIKFENGSNYIERTFIPPNNYQVTLSEPGEIERISPDISLKNNKPIVTYRGKKYIQHWIQYPNGGEELFSSYSYPIHIKYKLDDNNWGILWSYSSPNEQISPDVEGSRDAGAYIINFTVKNSGVFNKYVKIDNQYGYICTPQAYSGQDSKIMKGSYTGTSIEKNVKRKYYSTNES